MPKPDPATPPSCDSDPNPGIEVKSEPGEERLAFPRRSGGRSSSGLSSLGTDASSPTSYQSYHGATPPRLGETEQAIVKEETTSFSCSGPLARPRDGVPVPRRLGDLSKEKADIIDKVVSAVEEWLKRRLHGLSESSSEDDEGVENMKSTSALGDTQKGDGQVTELVSENSPIRQRRSNATAAASLLTPARGTLSSGYMYPIRNALPEITAPRAAPPSAAAPILPCPPTPMLAVESLPDTKVSRRSALPLNKRRAHGAPRRELHDVVRREDRSEIILEDGGGSMEENEYLGTIRGRRVFPQAQAAMPLSPPPRPLPSRAPRLGLGPSSQQPPRPPLPGASLPGLIPIISPMPATQQPLTQQTSGPSTLEALVPPHDIDSTDVIVPSVDVGRESLTSFDFHMDVEMPCMGRGNFDFEIEESPTPDKDPHIIEQLQPVRAKKAKRVEVEYLAKRKEAKGSAVCTDTPLSPIPAPTKKRGTPSKRIVFACPYYKHDPVKYQDNRYCLPGWPTVHRVKEHLYRQHRQPKFRCKRCGEVYKTDAGLEEHLRTPVPCQVRNTPSPDGFDADQEARLRSRKRTREDFKETDKWKDLYLILFPGTQQDDIPDPRRDCTSEQSRSQKNPSDYLEDYQNYFLQEMPGLLRRRLEQEFEKEHKIFSEDTPNRLIEILKDLQQDALEDYRKTFDIVNTGPGSMPELFKPSISTETVANSAPDNDPSVYWETTPLPLASEADMDEPLGVFDDVDSEDIAYILDMAKDNRSPEFGSDSGYNTNGTPTTGVNGSTFQSPELTQSENIISEPWTFQGW